MEVCKGKFQAYISKDGKRKYLGTFITAKEAAVAYNRAAIKLFGEFARLNQIEGGSTYVEFANGNIESLQP